jgi:hypothetical protein
VVRGLLRAVWMLLLAGSVCACVGASTAAGLMLAPGPVPGLVLAAPLPYSPPCFWPPLVHLTSHSAPHPTPSPPRPPQAPAARGGDQRPAGGRREQGRGAGRPGGARALRCGCVCCGTATCTAPAAAAAARRGVATLHAASSPSPPRAVRTEAGGRCAGAAAGKRSLRSVVLLP